MPIYYASSEITKPIIIKGRAKKSQEKPIRPTSLAGYKRSGVGVRNSKEHEEKET